MRVQEPDVAAHEEQLRVLFREYHEWTKGEAVAAFEGSHVPEGTIQADYDIDGQIAEDLAALSDPSSRDRVFVAVEDDAFVGCVILAWRGDLAAEIKRVYVRPGARGEGVGRALLERVIEAAEGMGCQRLVLHTGPFSEAAQSLYRDLGFEETAPFEAEPPEAVHEDWIFMERDNSEALDG
ncbi:MAG: GNAT family N-acetyltransferase [Halobacteriaceae archaeon]